MNEQNYINKEQELSEDTLYNGELTCYQYKVGYRYSVDALLVAHYKRPRKGARVLDLGAGSGIISLLLCYRFKEYGIKVVGLERQEELVTIARKSVIHNGFTDLCTIEYGDLREIASIFKPESFDQVVSNPPFFPLGRGRTSNNPQAYHARHHVAGGLGDFLAGAARVLKNKGHAIFIYPADHLSEFIILARKHRLEPKRMQPIYNYPEGGNEARLFVIDCQKNGGLGMKVERPMYIYAEKNGDYSAKMLSLYEVNK